MSLYSFTTVIFDLDGVITKTAKIHAQAWKMVFDEFLRIFAARGLIDYKEFTSHDYLEYVDGKPRYEGVRSFLESRGIHLEMGDPQDSPEQETVCGIGNRKNSRFREIIEKQGVEVYPSAVELIRQLRAQGIRIGVASSSKNCQYLLQGAGIEDLFEVRIDGVVSAKMGLKGKPEGDIFVVAAQKLGAIPAQAVVVEDASSGVQAGRNGGFNLVVGTPRKDNGAVLLDNGADIAVTDLSSIDYSRIQAWFKRKPVPLLSAWHQAHDQKTRPDFMGPDIMVNPCYTKHIKDLVFSRKRIIFFLDYDGTLTPIVSRPDLAVLSPAAREVLTELSRCCTVAIVSGRRREDVEKLVGVSGLFYAGSHGFDIRGRDTAMIYPEAARVIPLIETATKDVSRHTRAMKGVLVEEKTFSVAIHYRLAAEAIISDLRRIVEDAVGQHALLRILEGKKVFEIMPAVDWNKGRAVRWIMETLGIGWQEATTVYIGDDTTDEDAFRTVRTRGIGILVAQSDQESAADFRLADPEAVYSFFKEIITFYSRQ